MPATSQSQRRYFGWLEHSKSPDAAAKRDKSGMTHQQMHDFASTSDKGLPEHAANGVVPGKRRYFGQNTKPTMMADGAKGIPDPTGTVQGTQMPRERRYFGQHNMPGSQGMPHLADGANGHWMEKAFAHNKGGLHRALNVPQGQKIPAGKLSSAENSPNRHTREMANAAANAR